MPGAQQRPLPGILFRRSLVRCCVCSHQYPPAPPEILYWLNDSGSKVLFVDATFLPAIAEIHTQLETIEHFVYMSDDTAPQGYLSFEDLVTNHAPIDATERSGDDLVAIYYTGGTTGRSKGVMLGYWNLPEMTAEALRGGWLHTGDGGRLDEDGVLFVVDRVKDMIVSGGENVYSAETEQAIYTHPAVAECAVIGIPHDEWGEQVHAIVRLHESASLTGQQLIDHCKTLIAAFKCPKSIAFREQPLPLSGAGKILKKDLRAPHWEGQDRNVG